MNARTDDAAMHDPTPTTPRDPVPFAGALRASAGALAVLAVLTLAMVFMRPAMPVVETRYLTVAWEMHLRGDPVSLTLNGETYGHKPPLLFWLINALWTLGGVSDLMGRLAGPIAAMAAVVLSARLALELWPGQSERARRAALVLATGGAFAAYGTATMFDALLAAAVVGAMLGLWRMHRQPGAAAVALTGTAIGLGVLAKGPVMLLHVAPVALAYPIWASGPGRLAITAWLRQVGLALTVAAGLVGLWLVPALVAGGPDFRAEVLWHQSAGRLVESFAHRQPFWFYLAVLPLLVWPWGWWPAALAGLVRAAPGEAQARRLLWIWALGTLVLFSAISGKQAHYLVPMLPALALLMACAMPARDPAPATLAAMALPVVAVLGAGFAVASGVVPVAPSAGIVMTWNTLALAALAAVTLALTLRFWPWPRGRVAAVAPLTLLALLAMAAPTLRQTYDTAPIARVLAEHAHAGVAIAGHSYAGEFGFAARLAAPVAILSSDAITPWVTDHPGGVLIVPGWDHHAIDPRLEIIEERLFQGARYRLLRAGPTP